MSLDKAVVIVLACFLVSCEYRTVAQVHYSIETGDFAPDDFVAALSDGLRELGFSEITGAPITDNSRFRQIYFGREAVRVHAFSSDDTEHWQASCSESTPEFSEVGEEICGSFSTMLQRLPVDFQLLSGYYEKVVPIGE